MIHPWLLPATQANMRHCCVCVWVDGWEVGWKQAAFVFCLHSFTEAAVSVCVSVYICECVIVRLSVCQYEYADINWCVSKCPCSAHKKRMRSEKKKCVCVKAIRSISVIVWECLFICVWKRDSETHLQFGCKPLTGNETVKAAVLFKTTWLVKLCLCCQICRIRWYRMC